MISSWPVAFCFLNIVLAIFACVLVTHASILKNANELCLKPLTSDVKCSGIMASCKLEHSTVLAEHGLYVYAISMGISSVLMMLHSCCTKARSIHITPLGNILEKVAFQAFINVVGIMLVTFCIICVAILSLHSQILTPDMDFQHGLVNHYHRYGTHLKSYDLLHSCLSIFKSQTWNYVSLVLLLVCFICHGLVLLHMFYTNIEFRRKIKLQPSIFVIKSEEEVDSQLKIPSTRTFPNSPIFPHNTNMVLTPIMEKKTTK